MGKKYSQLLASRFGGSKVRNNMAQKGDVVLRGLIRSTKEDFGPWQGGNFIKTCTCCDVKFLGSDRCWVCADCTYAAKGEFLGYCNRQACGARGAIWHNKGNHKHYCGYCARRINECPAEDGSVLCSLAETAFEQYEASMENYRSTIKSIVTKKKAA